MCVGAQRGTLTWAWIDHLALWAMVLSVATVMLLWGIQLADLGTVRSAAALKVIFWAAVGLSLFKLGRLARILYIFVRITSTNPFLRFVGGFLRLLIGAFNHMDKEAGTVMMANTLLMYFSVGIVSPVLVPFLTVYYNIHKDQPALFVSACVALVVAELSVIFKIRNELLKMEKNNRCYFGHVACSEYLLAWGDITALKGAIVLIKQIQAWKESPGKDLVMRWLVSGCECALEESFSLFELLRVELPAENEGPVQDA